MTQRARYFDTINYTESEFAEVQNRLLPEGVIRSVGGELAASAPGGMIIRIATGEGMIQGFWYKNDANVDVTIASNNSGSTRNDNIVLRLNRVTNIVSIVVLPNAPTPTRTLGGDWEMLLATIAVPNGAGAMTATNITDQRSGVYCGYTGGGDAPDGNVSQPGMAFTGNRATGFWRNTPGGVTGGVRLSINATMYHAWETIGYSFATGGPPPAGVAVFHTYAHPGAWLQSVPNSGYGGIIFANHVDFLQSTKTVYLGYGTAPSQYLGGDGDLSIYTAGTASGTVILGTASVRRLTASNTAVTVGPVVGTGAFNVMSKGSGASTGIKLYHANQAHHLDIWQNSDATVYMTNVDNLGGRAPNSLAFLVNSGYVTLGPNADALAKFAVVQSSEAADQGIGLRWGGGYMRGYVMNNGDYITTSYSTATRHQHNANAFTPYSSDNCYLGLPGFRWYAVHAANATIGGCSLTASGLDPVSGDAYHIGSVARWHTIRSLVMNANSSMSTPVIYLDQSTPDPGSGARWNYGGVVSYIFQDASGHMNIYGPGSSARCHLLLMNNRGLLRPASNGQVDLGENGAGFANLWLTGSINASGSVNIGGNYSGGTFSGSTGSFSGRVTAAGLTISGGNSVTGIGALAVSSLSTVSIVNSGGTITTNSEINPSSDSNGSLGNNSFRWGSIYAYNGYKGTASWTAFPCDDRSKVMEAFRPYEPGLSVILRLRPTHYTHNGLYGSREGDQFVGLRADELVEVAPDLVVRHMIRAHPDREEEPEEEIMGVDPSNIMYMLVNAVQELHGRLEALEAALAERRN